MQKKVGSSRILRVKLTQLRLYAFKLALYGGGLLYLAGDLFWWQGPLWSTLHHKTEEQQKQERSTAISVYGEGITREGLQRFTAELAALRGTEAANVAKTAQHQLITDLLIRLKTRYNDSAIPDFMKEAESYVAEAESRASSPEAFEKQLQTHGYTKSEFTQMLAVILREQFYLQDTLKEHYAVSDKETQNMANALAAALELDAAEYWVLPPHRQVRHIFFATDGKDVDSVKQEAEQVLQQLSSAESPEALVAQFSILAAQYSQDPHSAKLGGNLGNIYEYPTSPLPELRLFGAEAIAANQPTLVHSKWGWHILLAGEVILKQSIPQKEYEHSLHTAIESYKRSKALDSWIKLNTAEAHKNNKIRQNEQ